MQFSERSSIEEHDLFIQRQRRLHKVHPDVGNVKVFPMKAITRAAERRTFARAARATIFTRVKCPTEDERLATRHDERSLRLVFHRGLTGFPDEFIALHPQRFVNCQCETL